jgi:hypothetical protein
LKMYVSGADLDRRICLVQWLVDVVDGKPLQCNWRLDRIHRKMCRVHFHQPFWGGEP